MGCGNQREGENPFSVRSLRKPEASKGMALKHVSLRTNTSIQPDLSIDFTCKLKTESYDPDPNLSQKVDEP